MTSRYFGAGAGLFAALQGVYFLATGVWPLVHLDSFLAVTGPKTDLWLVQTVGALIGVAGAVLLCAGASGRITRELIFLAAGTSAALGAVDVVFVVRGVIPPIYLADAAVEGLLVVGWGIVALASRVRRTASPPAPALSGVQGGSARPIHHPSTDPVYRTG